MGGARDRRECINELKNKIQLDATYYFIILMLGSTCFGHHYAHHQELATISLLPHRPSGFRVAAGWKLSAGRMDVFPDGRLYGLRSRR